MPDVALVLMPYADVVRPSLGLGLLKAALAEQGISAAVLYPNIWWAETIGLEAYSLIDRDSIEYLKGEWTFAGAAFPEFQPDHEAYFRWVLQSFDSALARPDRLSAGRIEAEKQQLWRLRRQAGPFVERVAQAVLKLQPRIVGCSSTFQQHCASLALLRRLKELNPDIITLLGGGNCEGPMGQMTHQAFPWVDFVVSGEADQLIGELGHKLLRRGPALDAAELPPGVFGPAHRRQNGSFIPLNGSTAPRPRAIVHDLDRLPLPDFDEYFTTLRQSPLLSFIKPALAMETSRGCWWGEKHHCTFCGLNGSGMGYRSKSPQRVLTEFEQLAQQYQLRQFMMADNILDMRYLETVLPGLAANPQPYVLFYETKANLRREQLRQLAEAGVRSIQPGIENMHDEALKLLDKGNNALMNIQLLKWALEQGINVLWNFLVNIPGERDEWYGEVAEWLPLISHLQPPTGISPIRIDRFSPYHQRPADFGLKIRPCRTYAYVYPLPAAALAELAYFFEDDLGSSRAPVEVHHGRPARPGLAALYTGMTDWLSRWRRARLLKSVSPPLLQMADAGDELAITDTRSCAVAGHHRLTALAAAVYRACDQALNPKALLQAVGRPATAWPEIEAVVADLKRRKLMLELNGRLLSLAVREPLRPLLKGHPGGEINLLAVKYQQTTRAQELV